MRPWKPTPEQEITEGPYSDYAAWLDWITPAMNAKSGDGQGGEGVIDDVGLGEIFLYLVMCDLCDQPQGERT